MSDSPLWYESDKRREWQSLSKIFTPSKMINVKKNLGISKTLTQVFTNLLSCTSKTHAHAHVATYVTDNVAHVQCFGTEP